MGDREDQFPQERRKAPRVMGALVEYYFGGQEADKKKAFIKDICIYGICIYIPEKVEIDTEIGLSIYLFGDDIPLSAKGKILWQKPSDYMGHYNIGIEFTKMSEKDQATLSEHIDANTNINDQS